MYTNAVSSALHHAFVSSSSSSVLVLVILHRPRPLVVLYNSNNNSYADERNDVTLIMAMLRTVQYVVTIRLLPVVCFAVDRVAKLRCLATQRRCRPAKRDAKTRKRFVLRDGRPTIDLVIAYSTPLHLTVDCT